MNLFANTDTERVLLASMLAYPEAYHQTLALGITAADFSLLDNRIIAAAIIQVGRRGEPVQSETALAELVSSGNGDKYRALLQDIGDPLSMPRRNVEWHVRQVKDKSRRRSLVAACERGIKAAEDGSESTEDCLGYVYESLLDIQSNSTRSQALHVKEFLPDALVQLRDRAKTKGTIGLPTGTPALDAATTGIRPGEFWIVGALSGRGKTCLGIQFALENAANGTPVALFSLEMSKEELAERFLSQESRVVASKVRNPRYIEEWEWSELDHCGARLCDWPLYVDDSSTLKLQELISRARLYIRRFGCKLIVVDYLRLIDAPGRDLREQVGNVADALRQLAKMERVGVVALSQLARPRDRNINAEPTMLELKESGDLEAHAHVVVLVHMPFDDNQPTGEDRFLLGKNRHGPMPPIAVTFSRDRLKFLPRAREESQDKRTTRFM